MVSNHRRLYTRVTPEELQIRHLPQDMGITERRRTGIGRVIYACRTKNENIPNIVEISIRLSV